MAWIEIINSNHSFSTGWPLVLEKPGKSWKPSESCKNSPAKLEKLRKIPGKFLELFFSKHNYFLKLNFCFIQQKISEIVYFSGKSFLWKIYFHELSCFASCIYHRRLRVFNKKCIWELKFLMFKASAIFYQIFVCHQMIALQELWKMLFISSKKLFFLKISKFLSSPLFLPVSHCFRDWWKINLKVCDVMNCLNKNLIYI